MATNRKLSFLSYKYWSYIVTSGVGCISLSLTSKRSLGIWESEGGGAVVVVVVLLLPPLLLCSVPLK